MNTLIILVSLGVALSIMVLLHELGHLFAAKRSAVVVEEFGVGYPPRLLTLWRAEGKAVLGGKQVVIPRGFEWPAGLGAQSFATYETEADSKGRQVLSSIQPVNPDGPIPASAVHIDLLDKGTIYSINAIPFGGFTKMLGEEDPYFPGSLASKSKPRRIFVLAAGSLANLLAAVVFFSTALMLGAPAVAEPPTPVVSQIAPGTPAEASALEIGDVIVQANDTDIQSIEELQEFTQAHLGEPITLLVERDAVRHEVKLVPRAEWPADQGPIGITLSPRTTLKRYPWYEALWHGLRETFALVGFVVSVPVQVIRGLIPAELARPVGPVGVGQIVGDAVQYSIQTGWWFPVMQMMASLSVALAVTNLLPLPALDGGRILFVVVEAIRGRRVDPAKEGMVHLVGMLLLLTLMLFITWQDVINPLPSLDWSSFF